MKYILVENIQHYVEALQFVYAFNAYHTVKAHEPKILSHEPIKHRSSLMFRRASATSMSNPDSHTTCSWCSTAFKLLELWNFKKTGILYICLSPKAYWFYEFHPNWAENATLPMYRRNLNVTEGIKSIDVTNDTADYSSDEETGFDYTNMGRYYPRLSKSSDGLNHSQDSSISGISQPRFSL